MSWPVNPSNGQRTTINGIIYQYDSAVGAWNRVTQTTVDLSVARTVSDNAQPNITSVGTLTSLVSSGNISGDYILGNGYYLSGVSGGGGGTNYSNSNVAAYLPTYSGVINASSVTAATFNGNATRAGVVTTNAQPNITSVGTLTSLVVTGNLSSGNVNTGIVNASSLTGTLTTATQLNVTRVGTLTTLTVSGNVTTGNVIGTHVTGTLTTASQPSITKVGTLNGVSATGQANFATVNITGIVTSTNSTQAIGIGSGAITTSGGVSIAKDLWVGGTIHAPNIDVTTYNQFTVDVPLIYLESNVTYPYNYEIGMYSAFVGGESNTYQHTGVTRNHNDNKWYVFSNAAEPTGGVIDFDDANLKLDTIKVGNVESLGNLDVYGQTTINNLSVTGSVVGNFVPAGNMEFDLGSFENRWRDLYLSGNTLVIGNTTVSTSGNTLSTANMTVASTVTASNLTSTTITSNSANLVTLAVSSSIQANLINIANSIQAGGALSIGGAATITGNITGANLTTAGIVAGATLTATGAVSGASLNSSGELSVTGNASVGNVSTTGVNSTTMRVTGLANIASANVPTLVSATFTSNSVSSNTLNIGGSAIITAANISSLVSAIISGNSMTSNTATITSLVAASHTSNNMTVNNTLTANAFTSNSQVSNNVTINNTATISIISANATTSNNVTVSRLLISNAHTSNNITINQTATITTISAGATNSNNLTVNDTADIVNLNVSDTNSNTLSVTELATIGNANITTANITGQLFAPSMIGNLTGSVTGNVIGSLTGNLTASIASVSGLLTATGGVRTGNIYDTSGTLTVQTKYNGISGDVGVVGNITTGIGGVGGITVNGTTTLKQSQELFAAKSGATGSTAHDFSTATTFFHTGVAGNFTVGLTNFTATSGAATVVVIIIVQGSTPYIANGLTISTTGTVSGTAQTIKWAGGSVPSGTASKTEAVVFTIFNNSGTYTVLGQLSSYG